MMAIWICDPRTEVKGENLGVSTLEEFLILNALASFYDHILMGHFEVIATQKMHSAFPGLQH